jgi:Holliday junction DNA helicase RuvA
MIATLSGTLVEKTPTWAVIEAGGIGFRVFIPVSSYDALGEPGGAVRVLTVLVVREDALILYGFATEAERRLFRLLVSVSGVGPKIAQGILSGISARDFSEAVRKGDAAVLTRIPGVGRKTAERLVLELKDKVGEGDGPSASRPGPSRIEEEAVLALISLGYKRGQAQEAAAKAVKAEPGGTLEEILRRALRHL